MLKEDNKKYFMRYIFSNIDIAVKRAILIFILVLTAISCQLNDLDFN